MAIDDNWECTTFDATNEEQMKDPYPVYERLRTRCPITWSSEFGRANWLRVEDGAWIFSRFEDIANAVRDSHTFSAAPSPSVAPREDPRPNIPLQIDPPEHRAFRQLIVQRLSHTSVAQHEDQVRATARKLIEELFSGGSGDLATFSESFATLVWWQVPFMGPPVDLDDGRDWVEAMASWIWDLKDPATAQSAFQDMMDYMERVRQERRANPLDDIPTKLLSAKMHGRELTDEEQLDYIWFLTKAAIETPAAALAGIFVTLDSHRNLRDQLIQDPLLIPDAIEELLRYAGPAQTAQRVLKRDATIRGKSMNKGDKVILLWGSANRDPDQYREPDAPILGREERGHLAFGGGVHRCVGMHLARLELRIAVEEILRYWPDYEVVAPTELKWHVGGVERALRNLPVEMKEHRLAGGGSS